MKIQTAGHSVTGLRSNNEDAWFANKSLALVADGMGGHAGGEIASIIARDIISLADRHSPAWLLKATQEANQRILLHGKKHPDLAGLGTTLTAGAVFNGALFICHVGDTRVTLIQPGSLAAMAVTSDHTIPGQMVAMGKLTPDEARARTDGHILLNCLGASPDLQVERRRVDLVPGQIFFFTSDGVHDYVTDRDWLQATARGRTPQQMVESIVDAALGNGSPDNCTAVVVQVTK